MLENLYKESFRGIPTLSQAIGIKDGIVVLCIIFADLGMFWPGEWAEKKFPREEY